MVIDHQPAFAHPDSPWFCSALAEATRRIEELVPLYGDRVLFTRFVPPAEPQGSWRDYYEHWRFAVEPDADWLWPVSHPWAHRPSIASHTFSKWTSEARAFFGDETEISLCGVSPHCCVMGTAFAAIDAGARVRVISDACAAKSPDVQARALDVLASRAPQLTIVTTAEECRRLTLAGPQPQE